MSSIRNDVRQFTAELRVDLRGASVRDRVTTIGSLVFAGALCLLVLTGVIGATAYAVMDVVAEPNTRHVVRLVFVLVAVASPVIWQNRRSARR